tara:strand:+ start:3456 stop:4424 length:969 start_codon:yes stop_codon:yes gene_type:complete
MDKINELLGKAKRNIINLTPYGTENFFSSGSEFLSSNTLIAKATFLLLVIILFIFLFYIFSRIIIYVLTPPENPFIIKGMKDATQTMVIPQTLADKKSIPIYRSKNEYDGVEFTYAFWLYVNDLNINNNENTDFKHVFHKGSLKSSEDAKRGIYGPNSAPGVYLYTGKKNIGEDLLEQYPVLGMLIRMNVFHNSDNAQNPYKYYDDIYVDGIPIKKWVNVVIRVTGQNIVDVYINGVLTKRHNLTNIVKQNYDNIYINLNGGFGGNLSDLRYYNYAIGTYEIYRITSSGPDLTISENTNIHKAKPYYLSSQWYYDGSDPLTN